MPELPEVEIVKQSLQKNILSKKIKNIIVKNRNFRFKLPYNFKKILKKKTITNISRYSKYIIFEINNSSYFILHLGMSGTIHILKNKKNNFITNSSFYSNPFIPKKHNHIYFLFNNLNIVYNDPRRFGFFKIFLNKKDLKDYFKKFGPEPFQKNFNLKYFKKKLNKKTKNIKNYLLDQSFVSGLGNIYVSEILFHSKINPFVQSSFLSDNDLKKIIYFSKIVLKNAIKKGGSSIQNFKNTEGEKGFFQKYFKVYKRENLKCLQKNCNGIIKKKFITNRSTFYCSICQKD